jgi:PEGA domain
LAWFLHPIGQEVVKIMKKVMILFAAVAMAMIPASASAARIFVGGGFGYGPYWGPGPYYWGPAGYYYGPPTGEIKVDTKVKDAEVWINGAFAGTVKDAHTLHLRPGTYAVEVRHAGQEVLSQQVFVAAGKTVHLNPPM